MAELFQKEKSTLDEYIRNVYEEGELLQNISNHKKWGSNMICSLSFIHSIFENFV